MEKEHKPIWDRLLPFVIANFFGVWWLAYSLLNSLLSGFNFTKTEASNLSISIYIFCSSTYIAWIIVSDRAYKLAADLFEQYKAKEVGAIRQKYQIDLQNMQKNYDDILCTERLSMEREYTQKALELHEKERELSVQKLQFETYKNKTELIFESKKQTYPWLASLIANLGYAQDQKIASMLKHKSHPALSSAEQVLAIGREKRDLQKQNKMLEFQILFYETLFPWLEDFKEIEPMEAWETVHVVEEQKTEYDTLKKWISPQEYNSLSQAEKYQLALDRYLQRPKTNWEIGIEFERYVGYIYESKGFKVHYQGALLGLEDMGRDLIAENKDEILVIQCKRWAKEKTIHEKHIFQLYGSVVLLQTENPKSRYKGVFITTTKLSEKAAVCASYLHIDVIENHDMRQYPQIKCNISKRDKEKIYHLPFDQQYDNIVIESSFGECYVESVAKAESLGFRRAHKWKGNGDPTITIN